MGSTYNSSCFGDPVRRVPFDLVELCELLGGSGPLISLWWESGAFMRDPRQIAFYKTQAWKNCRAAYFKAHTLCEECLKAGLIVPGEFVHHKIHVSPDTINDPEVLTNWDNLETLCRDCHAEAHKRTERRYKIDEYGRVLSKYP